MAIPEIFTKAEFYDAFGVFIFSFLIWISVWSLRTKKRLKKWMMWALLSIGIVGILVDATLVARALKILSIFN